MLGNSAPADILDIVKNTCDAAEVTHASGSLPVTENSVFFRPGPEERADDGRRCLRGHGARERRGGGGRQPGNLYGNG